MFVLCCLCSAQVRYQVLQQTTIDQRLETVERKNSDRQDRLRDLFVQVGCGDHTSVQPVKGSKLQNVICILPGERPEQVIIGAHFDHVEEGMGVVDNWAGASLLVSLYESLKSEKRQHTLVFIGFADEEKGMVGSRFYVGQLSKEEQEQVDAMINIDSIGLDHTEVWVTRADKTLVGWAAWLAKLQDHKITEVNVDRVGDTDSSSFLAKKIPAITFHSLTPENFRVLHSSRDVLSAVNRENLYASYRFLAGYVALVDAKADKTMRTKK